MARFAPKYVADEGNLYADSETFTSLLHQSGFDELRRLVSTKICRLSDNHYYVLANNEYLIQLCDRSPDARASLVQVVGNGWSEWFYRANLIRTDEVQTVIDKLASVSVLDEELTCAFELADLCESMQPDGRLNTRVMRDTGADNPYLVWCAIDYCVINGWYPDADGYEGGSEFATNYQELIEMINDVSVQDVVATRMTYS